MISEPLYTREYRWDEFTLPQAATLLYAVNSNEERSESPSWRAVIPPTVAQVELSSNDDETLEFDSKYGRSRSISLFAADDIERHLRRYTQPIYVDITGLRHDEWAPLVRAASQSDEVDMRLLYLEPDDYKKPKLDGPDRLFDLSDKFGGIRPLPGFVNLGIEESDLDYFVPMLGFEGSRLVHVIERSEVSLAHTYPLLGVPGFRPDYAFLAIEGNRAILEEDHLFSRVQFARANCPFEAFHALDEIHQWSDRGFLRVAPIGTKPHAVAAVMFALAWPTQTELIYDHPVRAAKRSSGQSRLLVFGISAFFKSPLFRAGGVTGDR